MLKFFRKYNKIILVVGCVVLMIAFLIQPVMSVFMPDPRNQPIGTVGDTALAVHDLQAAEAQLQLFERTLNPIAMLVDSMLESGNDRNLHWLLLKADARAMGLGASATEVGSALAMMGVDEAQLERIAQQLSVSPGFVRGAVSDWLMVEQYRDLIRGRAFSPRIVADTDADASLSAVSSPGLQRLRAMEQVFGLMNMAQQAENPWQGQLYMNIARRMHMRVVAGTQRLSQPVLRAAIQDQRAQIAGRLLLIRADRWLDKAPEPSEEQIAEHFERYRDVAPGDSEPHGFGYRIPDRVKLVYLTVPYDEVADTVRISEADALAEYENNKARYVQTPDPDAGDDAPPRQMDYSEVRDEVRDRLKRRQTQQKVQQIIRAAQGRFADAERALPDDPQAPGYKRVPGDYQPPSFDEIAADLSEQFGVRLTVERRDDAWVEADGLTALPGLGPSAVADTSPRVPLRSYVLSARAFDPPTEHPAAGFRLQAGLVSRPMVSRDGSMHLFRLTDAQPAHAPEQLDVVRDQVIEDLRRLAAFEKLADDAEAWEDRVIANGLDAVAQELDIEVGTFGPVTKREVGGGQDSVVPAISGIGRDRALIDEAFALARALSERGPIDEIDPGERIVVAAIDSRFILAILELGEYDPVTRTQYERAATDPDTRFSVGFSLLPPDTDDPLSLERVQRRVGYVPAGGEANGQ